MTKKKFTIIVTSILLLFSINITPCCGLYVEKFSLMVFNGDILYVGGSGPGNYTKIQDAINDAKDGDTIFVFNGHYIENVDIYKSIDLIGEDNIKTIIERDQPGATVKITTGFVNISNLNITRSSSDVGGVTIIGIKQPVSIRDNVFYHNNHGIYISGCNQNVTIENNTIDCYKRNWSRGVYCSSGKPIIQYNNISRCWWGITFSSGSMGQALHNTIFDNKYYGIMSIAAKPYIAYNTIFNNQLGINSRCMDKAIIKYNTIYKNSEDGIMFGLVGQQPRCDPIISNNAIYSNNYGINCYDKTDAIISNNSIYKNRRWGIKCWYSDPTIVDNYILGNGLDSGSRGGISYEGKKDLIAQNLIMANYIGIHCSQSNPVIENNTIKLNKVGIKPVSSHPIIHYNNIRDNSNYGVFYDYYLGDLNATLNWWGASDGPSGYGTGSGDKIGAKQILYAPWLTEENPNAMPRLEISNHKPQRPETPSGSTYGKINTNYFYETKATDPDEDFLVYSWDWDGDQRSDECSKLYKSNKEILQLISWDEPGDYNLKVKAIDMYGLESGWTDQLPVTIIKPELSIESITDGRKVSIVIKNNGENDVPNVIWHIGFIGGFVIFGGKSGQIDMFPAGEQMTLDSGRVLGFGGFILSMETWIFVDDLEKILKCRMFFSKITIKNLMRNLC